jgi:hypothetical protein
MRIHRGLETGTGEDAVPRVWRGGVGRLDGGSDRVESVQDARVLAR